MTRVSVIFIKIFSLTISQLGRFCGCSLCRGLGLVLLLLSGVLNAEMSLFSTTVPRNAIVLKPNEAEVLLQIEVEFRPSKRKKKARHKKEKFSTYRMGVSDQDVDKNGQNGDDTLPVVKLKQYVVGKVRFEQADSNPTNASFDVGRWSHDYKKNDGFDPGSGNKVADLKGFYFISLNVQALIAALRSDPSFKLGFWVVAENMSSSNGDSAVGYHVSIDLELQKMIRVSQLQDIALTKQNVVGSYYQQTKTFCVYVSENPYRYWIELTDQNTGGLGPLKMKNSAGIELSYEVAVTNDVSQLNTGSYISQIQSDIGPFTGSSDLNCANGPSPVISIRVLSTEADSKPDGMYRDTITVLVMPD